VRVKELRLTDFRSYAELRAAFPPGPQVIVGPNAVGKTNLLEALSVLALGHSHRTRADPELVRWGAGFARLEATVEGPAGAALPPGADSPSEELEVLLPGSGVPGLRKQVRVNGVPRRADVLGSHFRAVMFSPEAMLLVVGPPALRRDEIDGLAGQLWPVHRRALATYGRALAQRNSLLRRIREGQASRDQLPFWDRAIIEDGGGITERRLRVIEDLGRPLSAAHVEIAPEEPELALSYVSSAPPHAGESPGAALRRRLGETADKEIWNGMTLVGPHRDDAAFQLGGRQLAAFGSRGQQRTAILALKLAELDTLTRSGDSSPLLLLDDVFSELDPDRRAHLVGRIEALPQAFITTTALVDLDPVLVARATAWEVSPGRLMRAAG
jgi:DNA replication and repair protein RecF